jgi:hypothetical protein
MMNWNGRIIALFVTLVAAPALAQPKPKVEIAIRDIDPQQAAKVSYERDVKPILLKHCTECHSPDERRNEFETTSVETLLTKGRKAGPGVVPFKPDQSAIVEYIRGLRQPQMPRDRDRLTEDELHTIRMWIAAGAKDDSTEGAQINANVTKPQPTKPAWELVDDSVGKILLNPDAWQQAEDKLALFVKWRESRIAKLPPAPTPPQVSGPAHNPIDQFIAAKWQSANLPSATKPPELCDDATFLRRVYLDVIGLVPTLEEAQRFVGDASPGKRERLIDDLLSRHREYAINWTPFWEDALGSGAQASALRVRKSYRDWLVESFAQNKPYDLFTIELVNPQMAPTLPAGDQEPVTKDKKPVQRPTDYIIAKTHDETLVSVSNASQVFMGTSMKCAGCHNHFLNKEWPQSRFLGFAGLFVERDLELIRCERKSGRYATAEFPFEIPGLPTMTSAGRQQLMTVSLVDPLNPRFARSIVNRLWKRYVGLALVEPVDDFREDQPPSHPKLLDWLADDFMRHGLDLKHTIRLILASRTYQLKYDPALEDKFDVAKPTEPRYYRSPSLRRTTAEQLVDSVRLSIAQAVDPNQRLYRQVESTALTRALGRPASRVEISTCRPDDVAVVQSLELLNGRELTDFIYKGKLADALLESNDPKVVAEKIYLATLSRSPTPEEKKLAAEYVEQCSDLQQGIRDTLWAIFCSPEFQYIR